MSTARLESFSDGVIAVAITLLVLNIAVPNPLHTGHLGHALGRQWPVYAAYVTSFITIGIIWINHHVALGRLARADHSIMILNLLLLLTIGVIPFGTSLMASYVNKSHGQSLAAGVYGAILLAMALAFTALNRQILFSRAHLLKGKLSLADRRTIFRRAVAGVIPYVIATALAPVSPYATLGIAFALAFLYALPFTSSPEASGV